MKTINLTLCLLTALIGAFHAAAFAQDPDLRHGWVIGRSEEPDGGRTARILHTRNGGLTWREQGDSSRWTGRNGNDISALDRHTAWAALGSDASGEGMILHTRDGGATWQAQALPPGVDDIKGIKGLTRREAWAVSLAGIVLHTTDAGETWSTVEHPSAPVTQANRIDAIGYQALRTPSGGHWGRRPVNANIWIVDHKGGNLGMVHSAFNGESWRREQVPYTSSSSGMHMVSAYSPRVVWSAAWGDGTLFRTVDGGDNWEDVAMVGGSDDIDDMCAPTADSVWLVLNLSGGSGGNILRVRLNDPDPAEVLPFNPAPGYLYEGMTCLDDQKALVVGLKGVTLDPSLPEGVIVSTTDGGQTWKTHRIPVDDVAFWKTSFVGARR